MKRPRGLDRATLRGTLKVHIQVLLGLAVHNIRQLVKAMEKKRKEFVQVHFYITKSIHCLATKVLALLWADASSVLVL